MMTEKSKPIEILLVEDNAGDVFLTQKAFESTKIVSNFTVAQDGEVAMEILKRSGKHSNAPKPDLILLDMNLPKKDGRIVLKEIREDEELRRIPVVILSSSSSEDDIVKSYELNANSYILKPADMSAFSSVATAIENFWFKTAKLPKK